MNIQQFEVPGLAQYSYMVSSEGEAAVIDPMRDFDRYTDHAKENGLRIRFVTETHIHADFASGAAALAKAAGAELVLSGHTRGEHYVYTMPHRPLMDREALALGALRLHALHTPGHTPEHLSFVLFDEERSKDQPVALFSGDFLFVGSLGRPDLLGDEAKHRLAEELYRSLHHRIAHLPDGLQVLPGHGAGSLCGAGMSARPESTLGYERATQPLFKLEQDAFVAEVLSSLPPMPSYYPRMKELNGAGAPSFLEAMERFADFSAEKVQRSGKAVLVDLRRPEAFGGAHIPGSINIGAGQNLSLWAGWMLNPEKDIILIGGAADEGDAAIRSLLRVGLDHVLGSLHHGIQSWIAAGFPLTRTPQLSTDEVRCRPSDVLALDVRTEKEWQGGHIPGTKHIMLGDLPCGMKELSRDQSIIAVCGSGYRSNIAASFLAGHGFRSVSSMDGGMTAWRNRQLPLSREAKGNNAGVV